jgi:hypothetical protein
MEGRKMFRLRKTLSFAISFTLLAIIMVSSVQAQSTIGNVYVISTLDPNVITVGGSGFDPSAPVSLGVYLRDGTTLLAVFPDARTDDTGNFAANFSVPLVGESGIYLVMANTTNVIGYQPYVFYSPGDVPDSGSGPKAVSVSPDNSNIFNVTGRGLGTSKGVTLKLTLATGATAYTFADQITTDSQGGFSTIVIVPTSISGTYTLVASTASGNATTQVTIPNLKGATGQTGETGATGTAGATGPAGSAATTSLEYAGFALSIAAIAISIYALVKKR